MKRRAHQRGTASDRSALAAHTFRQYPPKQSRYWRAYTYALAIPVSSDAFGRPLPWGGNANLSNRWRPGHGKRHPWRRRHEPYWGERL